MVPQYLAILQDDIEALLHQGVISRQQPIYTLFRFIPARDWSNLTQELEENDFLLHDQIGDLFPSETWIND